MVSRLTGGTVQPGPGYNTGTLKSNLSGFTQSGDEPKIEDLFSDASSSENSDNLPLPTPTPPRKPALPATKPAATPSNFASPFEGVKLKPIGARPAPVNPNPKPILSPARGKRDPSPQKGITTDDDVLSDASKSESGSDLGDTTAQETESDWPEPTPIKPVRVTPTPQLKPLVKPATLSTGPGRQTGPGNFTKLPVRPITPKPSQPMKSPTPRNSAFEQLKPPSPVKKAKDDHTDHVLSDASDSDSSVLSDGMTTGHDSDYLTTV